MRKQSFFLTTCYFIASSSVKFFRNRTLEFLVADTRLLLAVSVGMLVCPSVCRSHFFYSERFSHYCSCPTHRHWTAVYPALLLFSPWENKMLVGRRPGLSYFLMVPYQLQYLLERSVSTW